MLDPRLEKTFLLGEKEIVLRPTFATLVAVEKAAGKPVLLLLQSISSAAALSIEEFTNIAKAALAANGVSMKTTDLGQAIVEYGFSKFLMEFSSFLLTGFQGPESLPKPNPGEGAADGEGEASATA